jgi:hypothetical protein
MIHLVMWFRFCYEHCVYVCVSLSYKKGLSTLDKQCLSSTDNQFLNGSSTNYYLGDLFLSKSQPFITAVKTMLGGLFGSLFGYLIGDALPFRDGGPTDRLIQTLPLLFIAMAIFVVLEDRY